VPNTYNYGHYGRPWAFIEEDDDTLNIRLIKNGDIELKSGTVYIKFENHYWTVLNNKFKLNALSSGAVISADVVSTTEMKNGKVDYSIGGYYLKKIIKL
jgi:hypothetical protein